MNVNPFTLIVIHELFIIHNESRRMKLIFIAASLETLRMEIDELFT